MRTPIKRHLEILLYYKYGESYLSSSNLFKKNTGATLPLTLPLNLSPHFQLFSSFEYTPQYDCNDDTLLVSFFI